MGDFIDDSQLECLNADDINTAHANVSDEALAGEYARGWRNHFESDVNLCAFWGRENKKL